MSKKVIIISSTIIILLMIVIGGYFMISGNRNTEKNNQISKTEEHLANITDANIIPSDPNHKNEMTALVPQTKNTEEQENTINGGKARMPAVTIKIGSKNFIATLYDNETTREFITRMPLSINMSELHGNEKYYYFKQELPTNSETIANIETGDLMLYGSDCLVLFYKNFSNSFRYTKLGKINNPSELANVVGNGSIQVIFDINYEESNDQKQ